MVDGYSDFDGEVSTTTVLPAPQNPSATVNTDSITVSADSVTDADGYRFYRAQSSGSTLGDYTQVADTGTPSYDDTTVEDGEKYYYRVTAYTQDTESDPSAEVNAVAFLPAPTVTLSENPSGNGVLVEWTKEDNSTDGGWRIDRRESGTTAWTTIANPVLSDRSYTDTGVAAGSYDYRVVRETNHDPDAETTASITIGVATEQQGFVVGSGENAVQFPPDNLVAKDLEKIPTGIGTARVEVPERSELLTNDLAHDRADYYVQGECVFTGYVVGYSGNERNGKWTIRVDGVGAKLEETRPDYESLGGPLTYTNQALDEVLKDYWSRTPFTATVTDQVPETVASNELIQSADTTTEWQNTTAFPNSLPFYISGGRLRLAQSCFTQEGENNDGGSPGQRDNSAYSGGTGALLSSTSGTGSSAEYNFTPQYTIPASNFSVQYRVDDGADGTAGVDVYLIDSGGGSTLLDSIPAGVSIGSTTWISDTFNDQEEYDGSDLQAGETYTLRFEVAATSGEEDLVVDVVAPYDDRYNYTFDDSVDSNGYLSGPELYPGAVTGETDSVGTAYNISASDLSVVIDDTSGSQALAVSNDGGATYTSASNTSTLTHNYGDAGRQARVKFTLSRYGSRSNATPTTGFNGQSIDSFEHRVDLNDLVVIDKLELSRSHFENLKKLHEYGDFLYTIEHDDNTDLSDLTVASYPRGSITKSTPQAFQNPENRSPEVAAETYYNTIYLQGRERPDGTRPTAEVSDQDAINEDGREISPGVLRDPSIGTEAGANFRANALLEKALNNNDLKGSISSFPVYVEPGPAYSVDFGAGAAEKTLERVNIRESAGSLQANYEFVVKEQLAETINSLKQNGRDLGDQV